MYGLVWHTSCNVFPLEASESRVETRSNDNILAPLQSSKSMQNTLRGHGFRADLLWIALTGNFRHKEIIMRLTTYSGSL